MCRTGTEGCWYWFGFRLLLLQRAVSYTVFPQRDVVELNPWIRTFTNGSSSEVLLPDFFREREEVDYRHTLRLQHPSKKVLVKFTCSLRCELLADGLRIAVNDNAHMAITAELPRNARELQLVVQSQFLGRHSLHQVQYDWWQPGGIFYPVELHALPGEHHIKHVKVLPRDFPWVEVEVVATDTDGQIALSFDGKEPFGAPRKAEYAVPDPRRWELGAPELHELSVLLLDGERVEDVVKTRFGLRSVEARDGRIHINGVPVQLLGVNRHHFGPQGPVVSMQDIFVDIMRIKQLGANFIRGAHYPQDPRLLDFCDEEGILVWEEAIGWQNTAEELTNHTWISMQKEQIQRMTLSSANHPSVIIYGFLNEGHSADPRSVTAYRELASTVREADPTRLVGWASSVTTRDLAWEFADVVGFNDYSGWYRTTEPLTIEQVRGLPGVWAYFREWVDEHFPGKPLIASEFGAGGQTGRRGSALEKWTEECQSVLVQAHLLGALQADLAGVAIWQLTDTPVDPSMGEDHRPHGINDKGLLTVNRTPKLAFASVYEILHGNRSLRVPEHDLAIFSEQWH